MSPVRIINVVLLVASIGTAACLGYLYFLKDKELQEYQNLSHLSAEAFRKATAELDKTKKKLEIARLELAKAQEEASMLNATIEALEKDKEKFAQDKEKYEQELTKLRSERQKLYTKIETLELKTLSLEERFRSLEELKNAIRTVKREKRERERTAKIEILRRLDEIALRQGNKGFIIRDGEPTYRPTRIRVELEPATNVSYSEKE
ncbi:MAG: hypothetical protein JW869_02400 [Candidatus Omnitrophica bacterium]|nr:hypothetical protein [Candidatus Omnitrophota bacterium]